MFYPNYSGKSLLNLTASILNHFNIPSPYLPILGNSFQDIKDSKSIVMFLVDGMGMNVVKEYYKDIPLINHLYTQKKINTITSIFPSSTANALTTLHTGMSTRRHRIIDWNIYFRAINDILMPLPFQSLNSTQASVEKKFIEHYSMETIYQKLQKQNIISTVYYPKIYAMGTYNNIYLSGASRHAYSNIHELLTTLKNELNTNKLPKYIFIYWPFFDQISHKYGPFSTPSHLHLKSFFDSFQKIFIKNMPRDTASNTGIILTADHGHISCSPQTINYLNKSQQIVSSLKKNALRAILPVGNKRDLFLHISPEKIETVYEHLKKEVEYADVFKIDENLLNNLFGKFDEHVSFREDLGNLLLLPKRNETVWYKYKENDNYFSYGTHGGLSADEMEIPLIVSTMKGLL